MWNWGYGGPADWWIFPLVMPLLMIVVMLVMMGLFRGGFFWSGPWMGRHQHRGDDDDAALGILRRRLASGEISEDEYQAKRKLLLG